MGELPIEAPIARLIGSSTNKYIGSAVLKGIFGSRRWMAAQLIAAAGAGFAGRPRPKVRKQTGIKTGGLDRRPQPNNRATDSGAHAFSVNSRAVDVWDVASSSGNPHSDTFESLCHPIEVTVRVRQTCPYLFDR
jgi:hypothetical protein